MDIYEKINAGKETVALRLYATPEKYGNGTIFHADVVYVAKEEVSYVESMGFYKNYFDEKNQYKGLNVKALSYPDFPKPSGYQVHIVSDTHEQVTLEVAKKMTSVLRPIERKLEKLNNELSQPDSFTEYLCRLAKVLKVKSFYHSSTTSVNDRTEYRVDDITKLRKAIDQMIEFNITGSIAA
jgi:hypothetical protein